jgi:hypothetical protein
VKRILLCELIVALTLSLAACRSSGPEAEAATAATSKPAQTASRHKAPSSSLKERAENYWKAAVDKDWKTRYSYLDRWQRASGTPEDYETWAKENEPFNVLSYEIVKSAEEGPYGWVRVNYESTVRAFPDAQPVRTEVDQKWQAEGGEWLPVSGSRTEWYPVAPWLRDKAAEKALRERYEQGWKFRKVADWHGLYQLVDPADRDKVSESEYAESEGLFDYLDYDVKWVEVVADQGKVRVNYRHKVNDPNLTKLPEREAELTESWVKVNNEWYRDLKKRGQ